MDIQASRSSTVKRGNLSALISSVCAAIVIALGIGIVFQVAILSIDRLIGLGSTFLWLASVTNATFALWLFAWTFARSWHVERRLQQGLDIDAPKLSILANLRN